MILVFHQPLSWFKIDLGGTGGQKEDDCASTTRLFDKEPRIIVIICYYILLAIVVPRWSEFGLLLYMFVRQARSAPRKAAVAWSPWYAYTKVKYDAGFSECVEGFTEGYALPEAPVTGPPEHIQPIYPYRPVPGEERGIKIKRNWKALRSWEAPMEKARVSAGSRLRSIDPVVASVRPEARAQSFCSEPLEWQLGRLG